MRRNKHHLWWPRNDYKTALERKFRNLPCNVVDIDFRAHMLLHVYTNPPDKPDANEMRRSIQAHNNKHCGCYNDEWGCKCTRRADCPVHVRCTNE